MWIEKYGIAKIQQRNSKMQSMARKSSERRQTVCWLGTETGSADFRCAGAGGGERPVGKRLGRGRGAGANQTLASVGEPIKGARRSHDVRTGSVVAERHDEAPF